MPAGPNRANQVQKVIVRIDEVDIKNRVAHGFDKSNVLVVATFRASPAGILHVPAQNERWVATRIGMGHWHLESRLDSADQQAWAEANLEPGDIKIEAPNIWLEGTIHGISGIGEPGLDGLDGSTGPTGGKGDTGSDGIPGIDGLPGEPGPIGLPGLDGSTGPQGAQGVQGEPGLDGLPGTPGPIGLPGLDGSTGPQGAQGIQGFPGNDGIDGLPGPMGLMGLDGLDGQGLPGTPGAPGAAGADGTPGLDGMPVNPTALMPAGALTAYAGSTAPAGWFLCDGTAVSRSVYAALFAVCGTTYGVGDGSTTFNLPDLRGNVPVGKDAATFATLGGTGGEETHVLTQAELASHTHTFTGSALGTHTHTFTGTAMGTHSHANTASFAGSAMSAHTHSDSAGTPAGTIAHTHATISSTPAFRGSLNNTATAGGAVVNDAAGFLGATAPTTTNPSTGAASAGFVGSAMSAHTHSDSAGTPAGTVTMTNHSDSAGTPAGTNSSDSAGTPAGTNSSTGSGTAHNNLQPYLVVNYIIKW